MTQRQPTAGAGFSLIEMLIVLAIGAVVVFVGNRQLGNALSLQKLAKDRSGLQLIEQDIRRAVQDRAIFNLSVSRNPALKACMELDNVPCEQKPQKLQLYLTAKRLATGSLGIPGQACKAGSSCPIEVKASFTPVCKSSGACDAAPTILIEYLMLIESQLFQKGLLRIDNAQALFTDNASSCPLDLMARTSFANRIKDGTLTCTNAPDMNRTITGVKPGLCKANLEILVGFAADGSAICKAIKWGS